jgi:hypothetical protein
MSTRITKELKKSCVKEYMGLRRRNRMEKNE